MYKVKLVKRYDEFEFEYSNVIDLNRFIQSALKHSVPGEEQLEVRITYEPAEDIKAQEDDEDVEIL